MKILRITNSVQVTKQAGGSQIDGGYCNMSNHVMCHAVRASTGTVWETCMYVWPSCVTGTPSGITSHQALTTIWPYPLAFETQQHAWAAPTPPANAPLHWCSLHSYWPLICFRSPALFLYDLRPPSNITACALHVFKYWFEQHLPQSRKERKRIHKGGSSRQTPQMGRKKKKVWRGVWWIFNFGEISNIIGEGGSSAAAAESTASCQESGSNLHSEDKTSFTLWLNYWWIILLFRWLLPGEAKSVFR